MGTGEERTDSEQVWGSGSRRGRGLACGTRWVRWMNYVRRVALSRRSPVTVRLICQSSTGSPPNLYFKYFDCFRTSPKYQIINCISTIDVLYRLALRLLAPYAYLGSLP